MKRIFVTTIKRCAVPERSGGAYVFDLDTKKVINQCGMLPFKARCPRNTRGGIRGLRGAFINKETQRIYVASNDTITVMDFDLKPQYTIDSPLFSNIHAIEKFADGFLVASCGNDSVVYVNEDTHEISVRVKFGEDINPNYNYNLVDRHGVLRPNSIGVLDDKTFYVVFANKSDVTRVSGMGYAQTVTNIPTKAKVPHNLVFPKNPGIRRAYGMESFYYCSSKDSIMYFSSLLGYGCNNDNALFQDPRPWWFRNSPSIRWGWLRGLFVDREKRIVVGSSPYARVLSTYHCEVCSDHVVQEFRLSKDKYEVVFAVAPFPEDWE